MRLRLHEAMKICYTEEKRMNPSHPSPWLSQLKHERPHFRLEGDHSCDVAVIGAGIAGVMTAYQILRLTNKTVLLLDAGRIAHGATGRNAGQVVSYFERPLKDIVQAFGEELAVRGQVAVESAWGILDDIITHCKLETQLFKCKGYAGLSTVDQIIEHLEEKDIRSRNGLKDEQLLVSVAVDLAGIPKHLHAYILQVPHSTVLEALKTENAAFIAAEASLKGCTNSAMLCEEMVGWMTRMHPDRIVVAEHVPVKTVTLRADGASLSTDGPSIKAKSVVLCTNGFENFDIVNEAGDDIDTSFHDSVRGFIGYMAGYIDEADQSAYAVSYHENKDYHDAYYYLTRRPYDHGGRKFSLVCVGGPERVLPDRAEYDPSSKLPADIDEELDRELRRTYHDLPPTATRQFLWQGLMGYTRNGIRRIGFEPKNKTLLYNVGCNGIGILPSVYGGKRIAELLAGYQLPQSIFDPELGFL